MLPTSSALEKCLDAQSSMSYLTTMAVFSHHAFLRYLPYRYRALHQHTNIHLYTKYVYFVYMRCVEHSPASLTASPPFFGMFGSAKRASAVSLKQKRHGQALPTYVYSKRLGVRVIQVHSLSGHPRLGNRPPFPLTRHFIISVAAKPDPTRLHAEQRGRPFPCFLLLFSSYPAPPIHLSDISRYLKESSMCTTHYT